MLDIKYVLSNVDKVKKGLQKRRFDMSFFDKFLNLAKQRGQSMSDAQNAKSKLSQLSKQFQFYKNDKIRLEQLKQEIVKIKQDEVNLNQHANSLNTKINEMLLSIPNLPLDSVPVGSDENDNQVLYEFANLGRGLVKDIKPHYEIAKDLDIIDIERAVKLSGSRYVIYKNQGSKLVRALINFMLDLHTSKGYQEFNTPVIVKEHILYGTGQLPKFVDDLYKISGANEYLIPTAEVTLTNIYNNEIIDLSTTFKATAYTECFRSEAGSSGKDTKGILRQHQFKKIELVKITNKDVAWDEYLKTVDDARSVLEALEIPYRAVILCGGDLGFSSMFTTDLELWLPSEQRYREVSSVSYFGDFQARRAMIRYRDAESKVHYAHTINGSGLAVDRVIAALLEIYQNPDGSISIPTVLQPYMNGARFIK
ncbi:seryl-tRNA synthetase [Mycoplasmopsis mustelae]|uniref:Serine--tRNA ligase n=1 Tax=Mycoplasmopsis mustelae TaxID=171289 RepID=A0A4R7UFV1_9BACT|nr:serine--tRNA ligase [Mycoplasmopsis mustelae]TDV24485.1 seryl-tRNA synthetase [Mycoplasmopsis mustelae]